MKEKLVFSFFMANTQSFNLQINGVNTAITNVSALQQQLTQLNNQFANAQAGTAHFQQLQRQIAAVNTQIAQTQQGVQGLNNNRLNGLRSATQSIAAGFSSMSASVGGAVTSTDNLTAATHALGIENEFLTRAISLFGSTAANSFTAAGSAGSKFSKVLRAALASTGLGLLVVGIAALVTYFTKTQEGADKLGRKMAFLGGILTGITNALAGLGKGIVSFIEEAIKNPMVIVDTIIENVKTRLAGMVNIFSALAKGDIKGVADAFGQITLGVNNASEGVAGFVKQLQLSAEAAEKVKVLEQNFDRLSKQIEVSNKGLERQANYYKTIADDATKSTAERVAALEKQFAIEDKIDRNKLRLAEENYKLIKKANALADSGREDLQKEALALDEINAIKAEIRRGDIEDAKAIAALKRGDTMVNIAARKEELEAQINANQERLTNEKLTYTESQALITENYQKQREIIELNIKELKKLNDQSTANRKAIAKQETALTKLEGKEKKEQAALTEQYLKQEEAALDRIYKAKLESRKLDLQAATDAEERKKILNEIAQTELDNLTKTYTEKKNQKGISNTELLALDEEYATQSKTIAANLNKELQAIDKETEEKKKEAKQKEKEDQEKLADARLQEAEALKDAYSTMSDLVLDVTSKLTDSTLKAIEAKMSGINAVIDEAKNKVSQLDSEAAEIDNRINSLEEQLLTARGAARDKIIKQLEQEREKTKQLAQEKAKEDARVKRAETEKLRLEKEKEKAIQKQVIVQQALQGVQAAIAGIEALRAGLAAAKTVAETGAKGKFGWDNIALIVAAAGALVGSIMAVKNAAKGFAEGGYTGDGGKYEEAGVVHKGEYVIPAWQVKKQPNLVTQLESQRLRGYADGGMVGASVAAISADSTSAELLAKMDAQNALLMANLNKPVELDVQEVGRVSGRVTEIKEYSLK